MVAGNLQKLNEKCLNEKIQLNFTNNFNLNDNLLKNRSYLKLNILNEKLQNLIKHQKI